MSVKSMEKTSIFAVKQVGFGTHVTWFGQSQEGTSMSWSFFLKGAWILTQQETTNRQLELSAIRSVIFIPRSLVLEDHSSCWWLCLWDTTQLSNGRTQESGTSSPVLFPACDSWDDPQSNFLMPRKPMKGTLGQSNKTMWHTKKVFL